MSPDGQAPATFIYAKGGNDCWWRAESPAQVLGARLAAVAEAQVDEAFLHPNTGTGMPWQMVAREAEGRTVTIGSKGSWERFNSRPRALTSLQARFPHHEGAAVFIRPCLARATLAKAMRLDGIRTIAETDDNYFAHNRYNVFARTNQTGETIHDLHARAMASMGINVFSTAWLRDRYHREYRRRFGDHGLPEMHVCRNNIPSWAWPDRPDYDGPVRVGFMGSSSHLWDIHIAYAAFHAAKHVGATTTMIGYNPANPDPDIPDEIEADGVIYQTRSKKSLAVSKRWSNVVDTHIRWIKPEDYHRATLPLDIGLAPLRKNDFTLGKSDVKAVEYTINGAACVLQRHLVYTRAGWEHEVNCLLAKSQEDMALQTLRLIRDPKLRAELVQNAQEMVRGQRNEDVMADEWRAALDG